MTVTVIVSVLLVGGGLIYHRMPLQVANTSLKSYEMLWEEEAYYPEEGFVPDAQSAKVIGEALLDARLGIGTVEKLLIPELQRWSTTKRTVCGWFVKPICFPAAETW